MSRSQAIPHARQRAGERYLRSLTKRDATAICKIIQGQRSIKGERLTNGRSRHLVEHDGVLWRVIYSNSRKRIITCLPLDGDA